MFELFFVITLQDLTIREQWPNHYETRDQCMEAGWLKADTHKGEIIDRYPEMKGFDLECKSKMRTHDISQLIDR